MSKFSVVTTFPSNMFEIHAKHMLCSFWQCWPNEIEIYIQLDEDEASETIFDWVVKQREGLPGNSNVTNDYLPDHKQFVLANAGKDHPKDYRKQAVRFSHKVFAMQRVAAEAKTRYLVWVDADVMTLSPITLADIEQWVPTGKVVSYLGRKDWNVPETGFMIFDLENGGRAFIDAMVTHYTSGKIFEYEEWTDAFVFKKILDEWSAVNNVTVGFNLSEGIEGRDVFEKSPLGKFMEHFKGPRKAEVARDFAIVDGNNAPISEGIPSGYYGAKGNQTQLHGGRFDIKNMNIQTKNCVEHQVIIDHVKANLRIMHHWLPMSKENQEEIVIASAGPSLNAYDLMPYYERGVKIIAVKHAMQTLLEAGIVPWACVLLDPREHVSEFVEYPHKDVNYFVASMCDPKVAEHLTKHGCNVYGYHASVGADEQKEIPPGHVMVMGGSATATRGISLMESLGFRTMHLFGYDCLYIKKPDLQEKTNNGRLKFEEVTLAANTWGAKQAVRTVWTEGQFLAQVQEFTNMYLPKKHLNLHTYGYGLIPWLHDHLKKEEAWKAHVTKKINDSNNKVLAESLDINEFLSNGRTSQPSYITGG